MGTLTVNEITIGYDERGDGDPLVLVHGHPFNRSMWAPQLAELPRHGHRVITPDLRGYGDSTVVPGRTPWDAFARDIAGLLDRLGLPDVVLGGLSMGGQVVLEFYRLFPARVRALVLADTFAPGETPQGRVARNRMADRLLRDGMRGYADEVLTKMMAPDNVEAMPAVADHVLTMMRGAPAAGAAAALRARADRPDYTALLGRICVPTLVVVGRDDGFTPIEDAEFMVRRIPGAELAVIDAAGHLPNLERPAEFNGALHAFLTAAVGPVRPG